LQGAGGTVVGNVAAGALNGTSTEAVNGSQLFATNQTVAGNTADITNIDGRVTVNEGAIASLQDTGVMYDDATRARATLAGAGGTIVTNVAAGELSAGSTDAVNGSQLFATDQAVAALDTRVTQNEGDISDNSTAIGNIQVTTGNLDSRITQNQTDITNLDGQATVNAGNITNLDGRVTANESAITSLQDTGAVDTLDSRVTENESDIADNSTAIANIQATTGNIDGRVTQNQTDITSLDGRVTVNEDDIDLVSGRVDTNENDIANIDTRVTSNEADIANVQMQVDAVPVGYVSNGDGVTPSAAPTNTVAFDGAGGGSVQLKNVSDGELSASSTDTVNGRQLNSTNLRVDQNTAEIDNVRNNLTGSTVAAVQYSDPDDPAASNGGSITNDVTLVGADRGSTVALHNVADGTLANDAANVGQMQAGLASVM
ncbi:unnamed protein product, partial [Ectocarpus sp. 8 AP-2014]